MDRVLVVGATGQLGTAVIRKLARRDVLIRPLVRSKEAVERLRTPAIDPVLGDLKDPASLARACSGVTTIIATANAAIPTRTDDTFERVERDGYRNLIEAAKAAGVHRFVYTSMPVSHAGAKLSAFVRYKRETEMALAASGIPHVIFRAGIFMDVSFAMMGSAIPLQGSEAATVNRPFDFARRHFERIRNSIEKKEVALIPGDGTTRHAFICVDDVACFLVAGAFSGSGTYTIGGPELLTFTDVVRIYERLLGRPLKTQRTPAAIFRIAVPVIRPFSAAASNLMCLNYIAATEDSSADPGVDKLFGVSLTSAEAFLRGKRQMAAAC